MHNRPPNPAHQALMTDLQATAARYATMPVIERVAVLAQFLGAELAEVPRDFDMADVMRSVSHNIAAGNHQNATAGMITAETKQ